jgi:hypothetical protein
MAERVGFEPTVLLPVHTLSKRAPLASRTPLRGESASKSCSDSNKITYSFNKKILITILVILCDH